MLEYASKVNPAPPNFPYFTSCGVLDGDSSPIISSKHGDIEVKDVYVFADPSETSGVVLGVWTFRGKLNIEAHFNEAYHDEDFVGQVLDGIGSLLGKEVMGSVEVEVEGRARLVF